ncbi:MAG: exodeoxyribonuclease III [Ruminococcus sp.]|nr:exodeoxyribonuclease III [Ruminococcus sp.]
MKLISWNVNGFRACLKKGFEDFFNSVDADVFCIQETKMKPDQADFEPAGYKKIFHSAERAGYSGTAVFTKIEPISVTYGLDGEHLDEGRVITCEFEDFYFVCCYTPNAQNELKRIDYRMEFEDAMRAYLMKLDKTKSVVYCGDLNVAHNEIDLKNPKTNVGNPGFSDQERGKMTELLSSGFKDTFRTLYPDKTDAYTWWSYRAAARPRNIGWRIDYFIVSDGFMERVKDSVIFAEVMGSDHCPVGLIVE